MTKERIVQVRHDKSTGKTFLTSSKGREFELPTKVSVEDPTKCLYVGTNSASPLTDGQALGKLLDGDWNPIPSWAEVAIDDEVNGRIFRITEDGLYTVQIRVIQSVAHANAWVVRLDAPSGIQYFGKEVRNTSTPDSRTRWGVLSVTLPYKVGDYIAPTIEGSGPTWSDAELSVEKLV